MKKTFSILFLFLTIFVLVVMLTGCKHSAAPKMASLTVSCEEPVSRAIKPTVTLTALENFELKAKEQNVSDYTELATFDTYDEIASAKILITPGTYVFTLSASKSGTRLFSKTDPVKITSGDNTVFFELELLEYGTEASGSAKVSVQIPEEVQKVQAALVTYPEKNAVEGFGLSDLEITENTVTYQKSDIPSGMYYLNFYLYKGDGNADANLAQNLLVFEMPYIITIAGDFESASDEIIAQVEKCYQVSYDLLGGTFEPGITVGISYSPLSDYSLISESDVSKPGYDFSGWYFNTDFSGEAVTKIEKGSIGNKTVYAKWTARTDIPYCVNYYLQNLEDDEFTLDEELSALLSGTINTYTEVTAQVIPGFKAAPYNDVLITADGNAKVDLYYYRNVVTLFFDLICGTTQTALTDNCLVGKYGASLTLENPTRTGYTFIGWNTADGTLPQTIPSEDADYNALWTANTYTIVFDANGGSGTMENLSCTYDQEKLLPANAFTKTCYTFAGWSKTQDGSVAYGNTHAVINLVSEAGGTITLYAKWTPNTYTFRFNANGGSGTMADQVVAYDEETYLDFCSFTKTGYHFVYWSLTPGGANAYIDGHEIYNETTENNAIINLYANYAINTYKIKFAYNSVVNTQYITGSLPSQMTCTYGQSYTLPANNIFRCGYTANGWNTTWTGTGGTHYESGATVSNLTATHGATVTLYTEWLSGHIVSVSELDDLFAKLEMLSYPSCVTIRITDTNPDMMWVRMKPQEHSSVKFGYDLTQCTDITSFGTMEGTTNLYYCYLPDTVTRITSWCFQDCTNLASVTISSNVREIGQGCFLNASGLLYIEFEDSSFWYKTDNRTDWQNHQDGSPVDFSDEEANCSILNNYTWYYYKENPINQLSAGTDGTAGTSATYVEFGLWPQTIKADNVTINENETKVMGANTYYKGSDGFWYAKCLEKAYGTGSQYVYSNGSQVAQAGANSYKYFKVEPIKWRVLTRDYNGTGKALLLAEKALTANVPYYVDTNNRTIGGKTIYPNNYKYSTIRAYLNGVYESGDTQTATYAGKGFLQTAFTNELQALIATTTVDNSARSTNPDSNATQWNSGVNDYACANTADKIFLLSEQEVTASAYGFTAYNVYGAGNTRIRFPTDYALANRCYKASSASYGSCWWLRSPDNNNCNYVRGIYYDGDYNGIVNGVVPALCITLP